MNQLSVAPGGPPADLPAMTHYIALADQRIIPVAVLDQQSGLCHVIDQAGRHCQYNTENLLSLDAGEMILRARRVSDILQHDRFRRISCRPHVVAYYQADPHSGRLPRTATHHLMQAWRGEYSCTCEDPPLCEHAQSESGVCDHIAAWTEYQRRRIEGWSRAGAGEEERDTAFIQALIGPSRRIALAEGW